MVYSKEVKELLIEKRKQGYAVIELAKEFGISEGTAGRWLREANVYMGSTQRSLELLRLSALNSGFKTRSEQDIEDIINTKYGGKFSLLYYKPGYKSKAKGCYEGCVYILCNDCGNVIKRTAEILKPSWKKNCECSNCMLILSKRKKRIKDEKRALLVIRQQIEKEEQEKEVIKRNTRICKECGKIYISSCRKVYCSDECSKKVANRLSGRRKDKRFGKASSITWKQIVNKTGIMTCALCGELCDVNDYFINSNRVTVCGDNYPSVDHIIPCACGGTDTWDNVQLAHRGCNTRKNCKSNIRIIDNQLVMNI